MTEPPDHHGVWLHANGVCATCWVAGRDSPTPEPSAEGSGTTTDCPLDGVHEHPFRGPHRFTEWYPIPETVAECLRMCIHVDDCEVANSDPETA